MFRERRNTKGGEDITEKRGRLREREREMVYTRRYLVLLLRGSFQLMGSPMFR